MTIKRKIYIMGVLTVLVFMAFSIMNSWTRRQVISNLQVRDSVNKKLAAIEEYAKWKSELVQLMSNMVASGHVPALSRESFEAPGNMLEEESAPMIKAARTLMDFIRKKEDASRKIETTFEEMKAEINRLYSRLDKEISTALALAQMDQVLGIDAARRNEVTPYVLKSLNQLTLTGLNALVSRKNFTKEQKSVVSKNKQFIRSQVHLIDLHQKIMPLFEALFLQLNQLDAFISESMGLMSKMETQISAANIDFNKTAQTEAMAHEILKVKSEAVHANQSLESASRLNFFVSAVFLIVAPLLVVIIIFARLNAVIIRPISRLAGAMKHVENGRFDVTAKVETHDEIGNLARAFNMMTEQLKTSFAKIEQKNRALEKEHDRFLTMMDAMNTLVHVTDPETYDLLFMNRYGREIWGDHVGKKCWEVLQAGQSGPCDFCERKKIAEDEQTAEIHIWEYQNTKNGEWYQCNDRRIRWTDGRAVNLQVATNITKIKQAEAEHLSHLHFLQTLDRIDQVIHQAPDMRQMLEEIIKTVYAVFRCDRACLAYPCDPDAATFRISWAHTADEYPLPVELNADLPVVPCLKNSFRTGLASEDPVTFFREKDPPSPESAAQHFGFQSQMMMALHPKTGKPWLFELHHCSEKRLWTEEDKRLFKEIGRRIADGLSGMLFLDSLRESEVRYRQIIEGTDNLVIEVDAEGRFVFVNETGLKVFGLRPEACIGLSAYDFIHPDDREETGRQFICAVTEKKSSVAIENRQVSLNGESRDMLWTCNLFYDENGDTVSVKAIARDITNRKRIEQKMVRLQTLLKNILNSMPSILVGVDHQEKVIQWNREAEKSTGISAREAKGQHLADVLPQLACLMGRVRQAMQTCTPQKETRIATHLKGRTVFSDMTVYPLVTSSVDGAVIRIDDVTEQVRMEEMMIQSEKMLSVGGLAAGMAHEINNPLAGIMQTACVLSNRLGANMDIPANHKAAEAAGTTLDVIYQFMQSRGIFRMLETISTSGSRVSAIVDNMLSFARKSDSTVSSHDLGELMDKTLELAATDYNLKQRYDFKEIAIERDYAATVPPVPCEKSKIQQVLLNILGNGAQAMLDAGIEAPRFKLGIRFEKERQMVCIEIEDNGPGMDEATRKRVFEPFFTTKPVGVGTGLGLSVSFFIITENHKGEMAVESQPGAGAKFIICLPTAEKHYIKAA